MQFRQILFAFCLMVCTCTFVRAADITWLTVGDANNPADSTGFGAVGYEYRISQSEVTNAQYIDFLTAKATLGDPYALYSSSMGSDPRGGIQRTGSGTPSNPYAYTLRANMGEKPVNFVSYYDTLRFANWLHNGGGLGDTETGAYTLLGGTPTPTNGTTVTRNANAQVFLPNENEWYKAAYYDPRTVGAGGPAGNYWEYATQSNSQPGVAGATATGDVSNPGPNIANYLFGADWNSQDGNLTTVGTAGNQSYYGTFDMTGNVWELNEQPFFSGANRGSRGGSWSNQPFSMTASGLGRSNQIAELQDDNLGFRVAAAVPEPSSLALLVLGFIGLAVVAIRRRK